MKKLVLSLLLVSALTIASYSQEKIDDGTFKPTSGFTAEVNFIPANTSMPVSLNYLKSRMFLNESMAVRLGLDLGMYSVSSTQMPTNPDDPKEETQSSYFLFGLHPGIELHMGDLSKLSPYAGAEFGFATKSSKTEITNYGNQNNATYESKNVWANGANPGYTEITFNLLLGFDYYFCKHIYCGAEIGLGVANTKYKEQEESITISNVTTTVKTPESKSMNMGVNFVPAIRLGWALN